MAVYERILAERDAPFQAASAAVEAAEAEASASLAAARAAHRALDVAVYHLEARIEGEWAAARHAALWDMYQGLIEENAQLRKELGKELDVSYVNGRIESLECILGSRDGTRPCAVAWRHPLSEQRDCS